MGADHLEQIAAEVGACELCRLSRTRTHAVPGEGSAAAGVFFLGEAPGADEDAQGRPFVGRSGQLLRRAIRDAGLREEDVFITNTTRCRPPGNRDPLPDEVAACRPYLDRQLAILRPALIVLVGRHALYRFRPELKISAVHGKLLRVGDLVVYPVFHPAAALRDPARMREFLADMAALPRAIAAARSSHPAR